MVAKYTTEKNKLTSSQNLAIMNVLTKEDSKSTALKFYLPTGKDFTELSIETESQNGAKSEPIIVVR